MLREPTLQEIQSVINRPFCHCVDITVLCPDCIGTLSWARSIFTTPAKEVWITLISNDDDTITSIYLCGEHMVVCDPFLAGTGVSSWLRTLPPTVHTHT